MTGKRTTVGLVFGGASGEHDVSIRSARTVLTGLTQGENRDRYAVIPVYIDRDGRWWEEATAQAVLTDGAEPDPSCLLYTSPSPRDVEESRMPSSA